MSSIDINADDLDEPDEEERQAQTRRLFTYSVHAIKQASLVARVFVNHPDFKASLQGCDRIFQLGREFSLQQGAVIVGPSGMGKTALIRYFCNSLPNSNLFEKGQGAVAVRLPKKPNVGHLVGSMLRQIRYPFPQVTAQTVSAKREVLIEALRQKGSRMLFVDEAHHLRSQTRFRTRQADGTTVSDCIREFIDEVPLGVVLTGTEELLQLDEVDEALHNRLSARFQLRNFEAGNLWIGFVRAFCKQCAFFDLSLLGEKAEAEKLHKATGGNLRQFKRLVTEMVLVALDAPSGRLEATHLPLAYTRVCGEVRKAENPYV
ncbi:TniB family NTP-binding protein [Rhizobacter sp. J219]|uniref:TniB family NTP-binding protein n=1 Tax=Rhizobacter sp. J219 TaxID=2898430 RepID=UPI002150D443|nr:TniB family NTP-binding protein [Rhizobacter sp. J219]MCR5883726.1 TniB family NTP-binding protein [Rhizobacter sp. J219]